MYKLGGWCLWSKSKLRISAQKDTGNNWYMVWSSIKNSFSIKTWKTNCNFANIFVKSNHQTLQKNISLCFQRMWNIFIFSLLYFVFDFFCTFSNSSQLKSLPCFLDEVGANYRISTFRNQKQKAILYNALNCIVLH